MPTVKRRSRRRAPSGKSLVTLPGLVVFGLLFVFPFSLKWEGWPFHQPPRATRMLCVAAGPVNRINTEPQRRHQLWLHSTSLSPSTHRAKLPVQTQTPHGTIHRKQGEAGEDSPFGFILDSNALNDCIAWVSVCECECVCACTHTCALPRWTVKLSE